MRAPQPCSLGRQSAFLPGLAPEGIQERAGPPPGPRPAPTSALTGSPSVHQQCPGRGRRGRRSGLRCRGAPRRAVSLRCCGGRGSADPRSQRGPAPAQPPAPSPWLLARGGGRQVGARGSRAVGAPRAVRPRGWRSCWPRPAQGRNYGGPGRGRRAAGDISLRPLPDRLARRRAPAAACAAPGWFGAEARGALASLLWWWHGKLGRPGERGAATGGRAGCSPGLEPVQASGVWWRRGGPRGRWLTAGSTP